MLAIDNGGSRDKNGSPPRGSKMKKRTFDSVYDLHDRRVDQEQQRKAGNDLLITKVYPSDVIPD